MAVIRVEKNKNYTCMSNYHLRDLRLSNKAVGLMCKMLSLPDDWDYSVNGLSKICKDGRDSILTQLRELETYGYLIRERCRNNNGQVAETIYTLFEKPYTENPMTENPTQENPTQENPAQLNTNISNTKELNKYYIGGEAPKRQKAVFVPPTKEEIEEYIQTKIDEGKMEYSNINIDTFFNYYNEADWHMSNGRKIKSWKQCLVMWANRQWNIRPVEPPPKKIVYVD